MNYSNRSISLKKDIIKINDESGSHDSVFDFITIGFVSKDIVALSLSSLLGAVIRSNWRQKRQHTSYFTFRWILLLERTLLISAHSTKASRKNDAASP
jgi:hypothetical protein